MPNKSSEVLPVKSRQRSCNCNEGVELIVIDESIENQLELITCISGNRPRLQFEVVTIGSKIDGLDQITAILASRRDLAAIHFIGSESDSTIQLGCTPLTLDLLEVYASDVTGWQDSLVAESEIFLYASEHYAQSAEANQLAHALLALTTANVRAVSLREGWRCHPFSCCVGTREEP